MTKKILITVFAVLSLFSGGEFFASQQKQVQKGPIDENDINIITQALDDDYISELEKSLIEKAAKEGFSPLSGGKKLYNLAKVLHRKYKTLPILIKQDIERIKKAPTKKDSIITTAPLITDVTMLLGDLEMLLSIIRTYFVPRSQQKIRPILEKVETEGRTANRVLREMAKMLTNPNVVQPSSEYIQGASVLRAIVESRLKMQDAFAKEQNK